MISGYCAKTQLKDFPDMQRVSVLVPGTRDDEKGICESCGKEMFFKTPKFEEILSLACCSECSRKLNFFRSYGDYRPNQKESRYETYEEFIAKRDAIESDRRQKLTKEEEKMKENNEKNATVENVNVEAAPVETKVVKEKKGPCPVCGGPVSKRGWKHNDGCTNTGKARALARAKEQK